MASQMQDLGVHIRWMIRMDEPEVLKIDDYCFDAPWGQEQWRYLLRQHCCIGQVAEFKGEIAGLMAYGLDVRHVALMRLAVHPSFRDLGVGRQLVEYLKRNLSTHRRRQIRCLVPEGWLGPQLFFQKLGFRAVKILPRRFDDQDGYLMRYSMPAQALAP